MTDSIYSTPGIGHNQPPEEQVFLALQARAARLEEAANEWRRLIPEINDMETAVRCADFIEQLKAEISAINEERKRRKFPHEKTMKEIDSLFMALLDPMTAARLLMEGIRTRWLGKMQSCLDSEGAGEKARVKGEFAARATVLRKYWKASITDYQTALQHYSARAEVREMIQRLADADARASKGKGMVPGAEFISELRV